MEQLTLKQDAELPNLKDATPVLRLSARNVAFSVGILICGPGEAKGELKTRLEKNNLAGHIVSIEPADKMIDPQIVEKVRGSIS